MQFQHSFLLKALLVAASFAVTLGTDEHHYAEPWADV